MHLPISFYVGLMNLLMCIASTSAAIVHQTIAPRASQLQKRGNGTVVTATADGWTAICHDQVTTTRCTVFTEEGEAMTPWLLPRAPTTTTVLVSCPDCTASTTPPPTLPEAAAALSQISAAIFATPNPAQTLSPGAEAALSAASACLSSLAAAPITEAPTLPIMTPPSLANVTTLHPQTVASVFVVTGNPANLSIASSGTMQPPAQLPTGSPIAQGSASELKRFCGTLLLVVVGAFGHALVMA
ncbi:hypothetical protein MMC21_005721 [Puttea exsequens]|nr:hypothetical protein [Puttea exsequens]